jgi:hypothetical protein
MIFCVQRLSKKRESSNKLTKCRYMFTVHLKSDGCGHHAYRLLFLTFLFDATQPSGFGGF